MKTSIVLGVLLIVLGVISLAYQGITYTTRKKVVDLGPIQATTEQHKTIPCPQFWERLRLQEESY